MPGLGQVVLTTYGRSSGYCIDPIEKKPLNHFLPGTPVLSFGTAGCNLGCKFCQNWDISKSREIDTLADAASPDAIARAAVRLGCRSVAFTYNDPVIFMEYAIDVAQACRAVGVKTVAVTAGEICEEPRAEFYSHMDAANVDLKGFTERFYHDVCAGHLQPVLDTLVYLKHHTQRLVRDHDALDSRRKRFRRRTRRRDANGSSTSSVPTCRCTSRRFIPIFACSTSRHTPPETLTRARKIALANGIRYAYTGNVRDSDGGSTWCHNCGQCLIERDWYVLGDWHVTPDGCCDKCGTSSARRLRAPARHVGRTAATGGAAELRNARNNSNERDAGRSTIGLTPDARQR